ncbi:uncharacterized protein LOC142225163 [Haematobia irritans]|uniref:uncharacterized protein LOC142225163 n=1 Tax=Haematobia irritans TaxID=7368 RepID=UPI003F4FE6A7
MVSNIQYYLFLIVGVLSVEHKGPAFKFTNLKCQDHDRDSSQFEYCRLKVVGRGIVSMNLKVVMFKTPINNITVNIGIYKKGNIYHPFLYNFTVDLCQYFHTPNRFPIMKVLLSIIGYATNVNHTCPYIDPVIFDNLLLRENDFNRIPIPDGQYMLKAGSTSKLITLDMKIKEG